MTQKGVLTYLSFYRGIIQERIMSNSGFVDLVAKAKLHTHEFTLWPDRWRVCNLKASLSWNTYTFSEESISSIPEKPGVYAFLIQPKIANNLNTSYLIYIGKTERRLKDRFQEYLREVSNPIGRPKIIHWLSLYAGYLYFSCTPVEPPNTLESTEDELLKAFIPPANDMLPAEVRRVFQAFR